MAVSYLLSDTGHRTLDEFSHGRNDVLQIASPWVSVHVEISGGTNVTEIVRVRAGHRQLASSHLSDHLKLSKVGFTINDGHFSDTGEFCSCSNGVWGQRDGAGGGERGNVNGSLHVKSIVPDCHNCREG